MFLFKSAQIKGSANTITQYCLFNCYYNYLITIYFILLYCKTIMRHYSNDNWEREWTT